MTNMSYLIVVLCYLVIFTSAISVQLPNITDGCIWYGECGNKLNCAYRGPAKKLVDEPALIILKELCPHLYSNSTGVIYIYEYNDYI